MVLVSLDYDRDRPGYVREQIQKLYAVEREARELGLDPDQCKQLRLDHALVVTNELGKELGKMYGDVLPKSPLGTALIYTFFGTCRQHGINPWKWLKRVLELIPDYPANQLDNLLPQNLKLD